MIELSRLIKAKDTALAMVFLLLLISVGLGSRGLVWAALGTCLLAMIWSMPFVWLSRLWLGLGALLGRVVGTLLLSVVYYGLLFPIGLIFRWTKGNPLRLKNQGETTFVTHGKAYTKEDLQYPF